VRVPEQLRIYIAGWFGAQDRLRLERDRIHALGVGEVVGTWLDEEEGPAPATIIEPSDITPEQCREYAIRDLGEVRYSDLLILDTQDVNPRGGREVEYGMALATGLSVWVVGPRRNVFHYIAHRQFDLWDDAIAALLPPPPAGTAYYLKVRP
jgi:hypothetical protein